MLSSLALHVAAVTAPVPDFTAAVVPDFRAWENTTYAGWADWSGLNATARRAFPDDPASTAPFVFVAPTTPGAFTIDPAGDLCLPSGSRFEVDYRAPQLPPVREIVLQVAAPGVDPSQVFLLYGFNGQVEVQRPIEVIDLAPGERSYRFLLAPVGGDPGTRRPLRAFTLEVALDPAGGAVCVDAVQLDVRHALTGEIIPACSQDTPNSLGVHAGLDLAGSSSAPRNLFHLTASGVPSASFGYFLMSDTSGQVVCPGVCPEQGNLCLMGDIARIGPPRLAGSDLAFERPVDLQSIPLTPPVSVLAGSTWYFQAWYRDANPHVTTNFTTSVGLQFR